jgi:8-oxo-dGTP pyrophosphatase MutT (NUDIX family)
MAKLKYKKIVSAGGIVFRKNGDSTEWLVTQHSLHKAWGFPKGYVGDIDKDEKPETAALREVSEEGGIVAEIVNPIPIETKYKYQAEGTLFDKTVIYYLMEYKSGDPNDHDWEVSEAKFIPESEVREILTFDTDKEAFKNILCLSF